MQRTKRFSPTKYAPDEVKIIIVVYRTYLLILVCNLCASSNQWAMHGHAKECAFIPIDLEIQVGTVLEKNAGINK